MHFTNLCIFVAASKTNKIKGVSTHLFLPQPLCYLACMNSSPLFLIVLAGITLLCIQCSSHANSVQYAAEMNAAVTSEITCPQCGHKKIETLPTEVCQIRYTCEACAAELTPLRDDCCVSCTYGDHKCPSKQ